MTLRPLRDEELYPPVLLERKEEIRRSGSLRERVAYGCFERPAYALGLLAAADLAVYFGYSAITAIEFGVGEGGGLQHLLDLGAEISPLTGITIDVVGFDGFAGLPAPVDARDHPEFWSAGDFRVRDEAAVRRAFAGRAHLVVGDIAHTIRGYSPRPGAPISFAAFDVDTFTSTSAALRVFDVGPDHLLPTVVSYFDDVLGSGTRVSSLLRNSRSGQLGAIAEFNRTHEARVIDPLYTVRDRFVFAREPWIDRMYGCHVLDQPARSSTTRGPLTAAEWQARPDLQWPIR